MSAIQQPVGERSYTKPTSFTDAAMQVSFMNLGIEVTEKNYERLKALVKKGRERMANVEKCIREFSLDISGARPEFNSNDLDSLNKIDFHKGEFSISIGSQTESEAYINALTRTLGMDTKDTPPDRVSVQPDLPGLGNITLKYWNLAASPTVVDKTGAPWNLMYKTTTRENAPLGQPINLTQQSIVAVRTPKQTVQSA